MTKNCPSHPPKLGRAGSLPGKICASIAGSDSLSVSVLNSFQLPTSCTPIMMPSSMSVSRDIPLQNTVLPGGGSCARAR
jgi:hypothetical protein